MTNYQLRIKAKRHDALALVQSAIVKHQQEEIQNYAWADYEKAISLITYEPSKLILRDVNLYLTSSRST